MKKQRKGYSVKQGRARSAQSVAGGIFGMVFSIIWTVGAASIGAPWFFCLFGVCFIAMSGYNTYIAYKNTTGDNRFSEYDVVDINSEPDPWDEKFRQNQDSYRLNENCGHIETAADPHRCATRFCPYCGADAESDFEFCKSCGRKLPD